MGCLPLLVLWLAGTGIGYLLAGPAGALWGSVLGLLAGIVSGSGLVLWMRRTRRRQTAGAGGSDDARPPP